MMAGVVGSAAATESLLQYHADVERCDDNNNRALILAAGAGKDECVRLLLAYGADIRPENLYGKDAFQMARFKARVGCIRLMQAAWNRYRDDLGDMMVEGAAEEDRRKVCGGAVVVVQVACLLLIVPVRERGRD